MKEKPEPKTWGDLRRDFAHVPDHAPVYDGVIEEYTTHMRKWRVAWNWFFNFLWHEEFYDGPFWIVQIGFISIAYSKHGLPHILQD